VRFGLAGKIFVASTLLVVAVLGISFGVGRALAATRRAVENQLSSRTHGLATAAGVSASVPQYRARLLNAGRHNDALDQANDVRSLAGAAWVLVTDAEGILIARTDQPEVEGIDVSRGALIAKALSGDTASGAFADDVNHKLFEAVSIPLRADARAAPQGALVATYELNDSLAQTIKEATNSEVVFFGLDTLNRPFVVGSTMPREQTGPALAARGGSCFTPAGLSCSRRQACPVRGRPPSTARP